MKIALVILNWNGEDLLKKFLPAIVKYTQLPDVDIIVADNASSDSSVDYIRTHFPSVRIIQNENNEGFAKGYNTALKEVDASIYGLVNSDVEVTENWLQPIIDQFRDAATGIVQPKIKDYKDREKFEYAGAAGGFVDALGYPYCKGRVFSTLETDKGQYEANSTIFWASGACFFIRSTVFNELGGFDEDYFAHQEEIDLCWRAHNSGYKARYVASSTVYHVGGATLKESNPRKTFLNFRNSLFTLSKNLPGIRCFVTLLARLVLDAIAGLKFLLELRPVHTWAIVRAHFSFYRYLPKMLKKRSKKLKNSKYYSISSIVWNYFILKKKKFVK